jgi:hypothetical protein
MTHLLSKIFLWFLFAVGICLASKSSASASETWMLQEIGSATGEMQTADGGVTLSGTVTKGEPGDTSLFAERTLQGNLVLTARISEFTGDGVKSVAGLALRESNDPGALLAFVAKRQQDDWITFRWRNEPSAKLTVADTFMGNGKGIQFLRLERRGDTITGLRSPDGIFWFKVSEQKIPGLSDTLHAGVFISSSNPETVNKAVFSDIVLAAASESRAVEFQNLSPGSPSLQPFAGPLRLNQNQLQPASEKNPRGYGSGAPWPGVYKNPQPLIPDLDIPGPDGLVYPNFRYAGVQGGIPNDLPVIATIAAETSDLAGDIEKVIATADAKGGVIEIPGGVFTLKRPLIIRRDNIVLRGKGPAASGGTTIRFEYGLEPKQIRWRFPNSTERTLVGPSDVVEVHADMDSPMDGKKEKEATIRLKIDDKQVRQMKWKPDELGHFRIQIAGAAMVSEGFTPGDHTVTAEVTWKDGTTTSDSRPITLATKDGPNPSEIAAEAAIRFAGRPAGPVIKFSETLPRGATSMPALQGLEVAPGDFLLIHVGPSDEWVSRVKAVPTSQGGSFYYRRALVQVKSVGDGKIEFNQPLRIEFEGGKFSWVRKIAMVQHCGVENLALEQPQKLWTHGIFFTDAANCWVKNVRIEKAGRNALWTNNVKWIEARDLEIHDAWFKGGGGTAYVGWENAADCLMDGVKSSLLRHGPNMQWSANGCVIRNGEFFDSDAQLHAGWPYENLFENCTVHSIAGNGSYGYGFFIVGPESHIHGPMGPRNVLFNNDINSNMAGLWFGGSNEGYKVLYNRFNVGDGPAVLLKNGAFDHTFLGNVFITKKPVPAAVLLVTPDCTGNDFIRNKFYGVVDNSFILNPFIFAGAIPPAVNKDNEFLSFAEAARPTPPVPSLFEWQRTK